MEDSIAYGRGVFTFPECCSALDKAGRSTLMNFPHCQTRLLVRMRVRNIVLSRRISAEPLQCAATAVALGFGLMLPCFESDGGVWSKSLSLYALAFLVL